MQTVPEITWQLDLTQQELTLVSKGLTGTLKAGDRRRAHELALRIAEHRARRLTEFAEVAEGALKVISELPVPDGEDEDDEPPPAAPERPLLHLKK